MRDLNVLQGTLDVLVLKAVSWGPRHCYTVARWIKSTSSGALNVDDRALSVALHRLEERGWLASEWDCRTTTGAPSTTTSRPPAGAVCAPRPNVQVMDPPSDIAAEGIPFTFERFTFLGFGRDYEPDKPHLSIVKRHKLPVDDAVVHFPKPGR